VDNVGYCWGANGSGQLGDGTNTSRQTPTLVSGGHAWKSISARRSFSCGVTTSGAGYCWGQNHDDDYSQLGNGGSASTNTPGLVSGGHTWDEITVGDMNGCGETTAGEAYCWGRMPNGLGDGTNSSSKVPVLVSGGHTWESITTGYQHTCGLTTSDAAYCWGNNGSGRLGDGTTSSRSTPTLVSGGHTWKSISSGDKHTCGVTTAYAAYCWGDNDEGKFGDGSTTDSSTPALIPGGYAADPLGMISAGYTHTCGVTQGDLSSSLTIGAGLCWGDGGYGKLGDGVEGAVSRNRPTYIVWPEGTSASHVFVSAGQEHTCSVDSVGRMWCWGNSSNGRTGAPEGAYGFMTEVTLPW